MSNLSQFFGGRSVPYGQFIPLYDYRENPTIDGVEYLRAGTLKSITGYESIADRYLQYKSVTNTTTAYQSNYSASYDTVILTDGTRYYAFNGNSAPRYSTNLTSNMTTTITSMPAGGSSDAFRFGSSGTTLISVEGTSANAYIQGTTATTISTTGSMIAGDANTAGTLGVIVASCSASAGNIYTSTNGTTWTSRTPSGGSGTIDFVSWCPVGSCFIYINNSGSIYTTTDGFTLTSRGSISPYYSTTEQNRYRPLSRASSSTSTLMVYATESPGSTHAILRTTNGTSFTSYDAVTLFGSIDITSISYFDSAYYVNSDGNIFKSTDDGVTWSFIGVGIITPRNNANERSNFLNKLNGNYVMGVYSNSEHRYCTLSSAEANYIGYSYPFNVYSSSGSAGGTAYLRIA